MYGTVNTLWHTVYLLILKKKLWKKSMKSKRKHQWKHKCICPTPLTLWVCEASWRWGTLWQSLVSACCWASSTGTSVSAWRGRVLVPHTWWCWGSAARRCVCISRCPSSVLSGRSGVWTPEKHTQTNLKRHVNNCISWLDSTKRFNVKQWDTHYLIVTEHSSICVFPEKKMSWLSKCSFLTIANCICHQKRSNGRFIFMEP